MMWVPVEVVLAVKTETEAKVARGVSVGSERLGGVGAPAEA